MKSTIDDDDAAVMLRQLRVAQDALKSAAIMGHTLAPAYSLLSAQIDLVVERLERLQAKQP